MGQALGVTSPPAAFPMGASRAPGAQTGNLGALRLLIDFASIFARVPKRTKKVSQSVLVG